MPTYYNEAGALSREDLLRMIGEREAIVEWWYRQSREANARADKYKTKLDAFRLEMSKIDHPQVQFLVYNPDLPI